MINFMTKPQNKLPILYRITSKLSLITSILKLFDKK